MVRATLRTRWTARAERPRRSKAASRSASAGLVRLRVPGQLAGSMAALTGVVQPARSGRAGARGPRDPLGDPGGALARGRAELPQLDRRHLDVEVDAVEQRSRDPPAVALDHRRRAAAVVAPVPAVAAGAGVHRRHQREAGREAQAGPGADHGDHALLTAGAGPPGCRAGTRAARRGRAPRSGRG